MASKRDTRMLSLYIPWGINGSYALVEKTLVDPYMPRESRVGMQGFRQQVQGIPSGLGASSEGTQPFVSPAQLIFKMNLFWNIFS